jgi:hypothetical protein
MCFLCLSNTASFLVRTPPRPQVAT